VFRSGRVHLSLSGSATRELEIRGKRVQEKGIQEKTPNGRGAELNHGQTQKIRRRSSSGKLMLATWLVSHNLRHTNRQCLEQPVLNCLQCETGVSPNVGIHRGGTGRSGLEVLQGYVECRWLPCLPMSRSCGWIRTPGALNRDPPDLNVRVRHAAVSAGGTGLR
jgi:hypothetical protein